MNLVFTTNAWEDFEYWLDHDKEMAEKIRALLKDIVRNPFQGLGKPEPMKYDLKGYWSRRISGEHRLVYKIEGEKKLQYCIIIQCRFDYD